MKSSITPAYCVPKIIERCSKAGAGHVINVPGMVMERHDVDKNGLYT